MDKLLYRQGVYGIILNSLNRILLVHKKNSNSWNLPGGGIDKNETQKIALLRELGEELSINNIEILHKASFTYKYDWTESEKEKHFKKTGLQLRGQEQSFFILKFLGNDKEIKLQKEELTGYKWIELSKMDEFIKYPDKCEVVSQALSEFKLVKKQ